MRDIALIGKKIGMTREFYKTGQSVPVTVIKMEKARVIQVIDSEKRGYKAIQNDGQLQSWEQTKSGDSTDVNQVEDGVQVINGEVVEVKNGEIVKGIDPNSNGDITNTGEYKSGYNDGYRDGVNETASAVELTNKETAKGNTRGTAFNTEYTYSGGDIDPRDIAPNHSILEQGFKNPFSPGFSTFASGKKSRPEDTVPDGAFGIGSKSTDSKKKAWWDPLGVFTGKSIGGLVPARLKGASTGKCFFFGKIFEQITGHDRLQEILNGIETVSYTHLTLPTKRIV